MAVAAWCEWWQRGSSARRAWKWSLAAAFAAVVLVGCVGPAPPKQAADPADPDQVDAGNVGNAGDARGPASRRHELSGDVLYKLLVGELAADRGQVRLSFESYLEIARKTRDPAVTARAAQLAVRSGDSGKALEVARLWHEVDPSSLEARRVLATLLLRSGETGAAVEHLGAIVEMTADSPGGGFNRVAVLLAEQRDQEVALAAMRRLLAGSEDDAAAQVALARLLVRFGRIEEASGVIDRAAELDPDDERTAVLRARMRQRMDDVEGAVGVMEEFLGRFPDAGVARMAYARMLVDTRRYDDALVEFERLIASEPDNDDARYAFGLLLVQTERLDEAKRQFESLTRGGARRDAAHYYLARIAESQQRPDEAIGLYRRVRRGEHRLDAQVRVAVLLAEGGDLESARRHLHGIRSQNARQTVRIYRVEAGMLVRAGRYDEAMAVFDASLREVSGNPELLYARGMLAERMDRLDLFERDMREIIAREPDHADALNALGYTLADRTDRYEEAYALIKRALELKPDESYIVDSMGWVLYRLGRHQEALEQLRRAMSINPDPEIAAHLGEVLWVVGQQAEAREVWSTALETTPDDQRLLDVIERFGL